jgi:hypothetical protein
MRHFGALPGNDPDGDAFVAPRCDDGDASLVRASRARHAHGGSGSGSDHSPRRAARASSSSAIIARSFE